MGIRQAFALGVVLGAATAGLLCVVSCSGRRHCSSDVNASAGGGGRIESSSLFHAAAAVAGARALRDAIVVFPSRSAQQQSCASTSERRLVLLDSSTLPTADKTKLESESALELSLSEICSIVHQPEQFLPPPTLTPPPPPPPPVSLPAQGSSILGFLARGTAYLAVLSLLIGTVLACILARRAIHLAESIAAPTLHALAVPAEAAVATAATAGRAALSMSTAALHVVQSAAEGAGLAAAIGLFTVRTMREAWLYLVGPATEAEAAPDSPPSPPHTTPPLDKLRIASSRLRALACEALQSGEDGGGDKKRRRRFSSRALLFDAVLTPPRVGLKAGAMALEWLLPA